MHVCSLRCSGKLPRHYLHRYFVVAAVAIVVISVYAPAAMTLHFLQSLVHIFSAYFNEGKKIFNEVNYRAHGRGIVNEPYRHAHYLNSIDLFFSANNIHLNAPQERIRDNFTLVYELLDGLLICCYRIKRHTFIPVAGGKVILNFNASSTVPYCHFLFGWLTGLLLLVVLVVVVVVVVFSLSFHASCQNAMAMCQ